MSAAEGRRVTGDVQQTNDTGKLIYKAAKEGNVEELRTLLELPQASEACVYVGSENEHTPLSIAAVNKHLACMEALIPLVPPSEVVKQMAKAESQSKDSSILQKLKIYTEDVKRFETTRIHMQKEASMIADRGTCTVGDLQRFSILLEHLIMECGYVVDGDDNTVPLLIRATLSGNMVIAVKLIEDYKASLYISTQKMGTPLHIACQRMSPLRYYYVTKCPTLLAVPDSTASLPFHIACQNNDVEFIGWLFGSILTQASKHLISERQVHSPYKGVRRVGSLPLLSPKSNSNVALSSPVNTAAFHFGIPEVENQDDGSDPEDQGIQLGTTSFHSASLCFGEEVTRYFNNLNEPCANDAVLEVDVAQFKMNSPSLLKIAEDKLLAITVHGHSMFHIAVLNNSEDLLRTLLIVAWFMCHTLDLKLNLKVIFVGGDETPVAIAIKKKHDKCLVLLLEFLKDVDLLKVVATDGTLLKIAVGTGSLQMVKVLVQFGITKGLDKAISLAAGNRFHEILHLLLYHHTQLTNMHDYKPLQSERKTERLVGEIKWSQLPIAEIQAEWIQDSLSAIESVYSAMSMGSKDLNSLTSNCLRYFDNKADPSAENCSLLVKLISITTVELGGCGLTSVPPELFQMPHLTTLTLAHNSIQELPTALNSSMEEVYTCRSLKKLVLDDNQLTTLPEDLFLGLVSSLEVLSVQRNRLSDLPPGIWVMPLLKTLTLSGNMLSRLHYFSGSSDVYFSDLEAGRDSRNVRCLQLFYQTLCRALKVSEDFEVLVEQIRKQRQASRDVSSVSSTAYSEVSTGEEDDHDISHLQLLDLSSNMFSELPSDLVCLAPRLNRLEMRYNQIVKLDLARSMPRSISTITLDHNLIFNTVASRPAYLLCSSPRMMLVPQPQEGCLYCSHASHTILGRLSTLVLSYNKIEDFLVCNDVEYCLSGGSHMSSSLGPPVTSQPVFPMLSILALDHNVLKTIPKSIHLLSALGSLDFSYNVAIQELPLELGLLDPQTLCVLRLQGLNIHGVPPSLLEKSSPRPLLAFLKSQLRCSKPYHRIKLMIMGSVKAGKTTLLQQLTKRGTMDRRKEVEMGVNGEPLSTVGVDLGDWVYRPQTGSPKVTFMTWDFGGQEEYYATHQCFLTHRSLYLVVWDATEGEKGLESIKSWLENIEARAPGAPVIVVGTHADCIKHDEKKHLESLFEQLYINYNSSQFAYPSIEPQCQFVNCFDSCKMKSFRDYIYDRAMNYKKPGSKHSIALMSETAPQFCISLEDHVRKLANQYAKEGKIPVLTREAYCAAVCPLLDTSEGLDEATIFLHDNGILLHYEDSQLSDLYFIDPQWLCTMMAKVITIQEKNPYQKNGLMLVQDLDKIFTDNTTKPFIKDLIKIMHKFEVVLLLDEERLLIPSLLPVSQELACVVSRRSNGSISCTSSSTSDNLPALMPPPTSPNTLPSSPFPHTLSRYTFLHFIPNGFFSRLIARVISGPILAQCSKWLTWPWPREEENSTEAPHWCCWRNGVKLVWNNIQVFKIVPVDCPLAGHKRHKIISGKESLDMDLPKGVEIKVSVLPEECITQSCMTTPAGGSQAVSKDICVATWLLQKGTECVLSVLEDWYEIFGKKRGIQNSTLNTAASPCPHCMGLLHTNDAEVASSSVKDVSYFFSGPYCALVVSEGKELKCPLHGNMSVGNVAPDMMFRDFVPAMIFDSRDITKTRALGDGGFGAVFAGSVSSLGNIALKEFLSQGVVEENASLVAELSAWEIYHNASQEARVMYTLNHENILKLLGVSLAPVRLLLELAPLGDLKVCVQKFQQAKVKLSRAILQSTMMQVAEALNYLHSHSFIYRDLKPGNVLVWKFPSPETQWTGDQTVQLKLADYGICQQFTPQGVRGLLGTPPYLPPEVLLHGGLEAYSTKLDVYSFGMFMYYLFTFCNPFHKEGRSPAALLNDGKRPELPLKLRPTSLWMIELMCWCWSEKPQHRPTFTEILRVLRDSTFTSLTSAVELNDTSIVAACYKFVGSRVPGTSPITSPRSLTSSISPFTSPRSSVTSPLPSMSSEADASNAICPAIGLYGAENATLEVWYGGNECLSVVTYHPTSVTIQAVDRSSLKFVSSICITADLVWVATFGAGLHVYSTTTRKKVAKWEGSNKVFKLISMEHCTGCVLALACEGVHVFAVNEVLQQIGVLQQSGTGSLYELVTKFSHGLKDDLFSGTLAGTYSDEVWAVSSSADGNTVVVLDCTGAPKTAISGHVRPGRRLKHITAQIGTNHVLLSDRHYVELWEVEQRRLVKEFDCSELCRQNFNHSKTIDRFSRVTTMLYFNDVIYVGTGGGVVLVLSSELQPLTFYHVCAGPCRSLMGIQSVKQVKSFSRFFSRSHQVTEASTSTTSILDGESMDARRGSSSMSNEILHSSSSEVSADSIVIGIAGSYLRVTGNSPNVPPNLNPPGDPPTCTTPPYPYLLTKPPKADVILTWLAYSIPTSKNDESGGEQLEINIDE